MDRLGPVGKACDIVGHIIVGKGRKEWLVIGYWPELDPSHNHNGTM